MFYLAGISIAFFLSGMLFSKKHRNLADVILACWLLVVGIHLYFYYAGISGIIFNYPWMLGIHLPIPLLHGPFLFLYAQTQTSRISRLKAKHYLHFLPALADYVYLIHFFLLSNEEKISVYQGHGQAYPFYIPLNFVCIVISGTAYIIFSLLLLRKHRKQILQEFSATEKINLLWVQYLIYGLACIWLLVIFGDDNLVFGASVFFVIFIGYYGIKQVGVFSSQPTVMAETMAISGNEDTTADEAVVSVRTEEQTDNNFLSKYQKSGLTDLQKLKIQEKLARIMDEEHLFTLCELTLSQLATKLEVHPNHLSQVLNEQEGKNFYDYINTLRVQYFLLLLQQDTTQQKTLLALAYESGFNSKSTFNKYFKKVHGITPSEYLNRQRNITL